MTSHFLRHDARGSTGSRSFATTLGVLETVRLTRVGRVLLVRVVALVARGVLVEGVHFCRAVVLPCASVSARWG